MTLLSVTADHSFAGEVEASNTPTIRRLTPSCRHQLPRIAHYHVEVSMGRRGGVPVLRGTRVTVAEVLAEIADSSGVQEIADNFKLDAEQVKGVISALSLLVSQP